MREALHTDAREKSCAVLNFAPFDLLVCIVARSLEKYRSLSLVSFLARYRSLSLSLSLTGLIWTTCLNQFLDNFEEMCFAIPRQCRRNFFSLKPISLSVLQSFSGSDLSKHVDTSLLWPFLAGYYLDNVS